MSPSARQGTGLPWIIAAAGIPLCALVAVLTVGHYWRLLPDLPQAVRPRIAADLLVLETGLLVLFAPVFGVAAVAGRSAARRGVWSIDGRAHVRAAVGVASRLLVGFGATAATALGLASILVGSPLATGSPLTVPHLTLFVVALALGALGALVASSVAHPLDAAAGAVGITLVASFGLLAGGPATASLPTGALDAALQASPIVAVASAAGVDLLRSEWLYRLSPVAHLRFDYPTALATCGWYGGLTVVAFLAIITTSARRIRA